MIPQIVERRRYMDYYSEQDAKEYNDFCLKMAQKIIEIQEEVDKLSPQNKMRAKQAADSVYLSLKEYKGF